MANKSKERGTKESPWQLKTPPGTSDYEMYKDEKDGKQILVCTVGKTILHYDYRCINDLYAMLRNMATGLNSAVLMNKSLQKKERLKPGVVHQRTR